MRILLTNDDGVFAPGLEVLEEIARSISDDVWIVAPESDQSGVSHSLSLNDPLRLRQVDERKFAVRGTPTDCVIMGVRHVLQGKQIDLLLSGGVEVAMSGVVDSTLARSAEVVIDVEVLEQIPGISAPLWFYDPTWAKPASLTNVTVPGPETFDQVMTVVDLCKQAGMSGHIPKPFKREELLSAIASAAAHSN